MLTGHLVDGVFLAVSNILWDDLDERQRELMGEAADAAVMFNNNNRLRQERELLAFFESEGLTVTTPDVDAFRTQVQQMYLESEFSETWPEGLIDRINAVE